MNDIPDESVSACLKAAADELLRQELNGEQELDVMSALKKITVDRVSIAGPIAKDYKAYHLRNDPKTQDFALSLVTGRPFPPPLLTDLVALVENIAKVFCGYERVRFQPYPDEAMHATLGPVKRTTFDAKLYRRDREEVKRRQLEELLVESLELHDIRAMSLAELNRKFRPAIDLEKLKVAVERAEPFHLDLSEGQFKITGRGELLLLGKAAKPAEPLRKLKRELAQLGLPKWDQGTELHVTLGTIAHFHLLTRPEKADIAQALHDLLKNTTLAKAEIGCAQLVLYSHRSLARDLWSQTFLMRGSVATGGDPAR